MIAATPMIMGRVWVTRWPRIDPRVSLAPSLMRLPIATPRTIARPPGRRLCRGDAPCDKWHKAIEGESARGDPAQTPHGMQRGRMAGSARSRRMLPHFRSFRLVGIDLQPHLGEGAGGGQRLP